MSFCYTLTLTHTDFEVAFFSLEKYHFLIEENFDNASFLKFRDQRQTVENIVHEIKIFSLSKKLQL